MVDFSKSIYKIYSWSTDVPVANVIITLAVVHFFQLLTVLLAVDQFLIPLPGLFDLPKGVVWAGALVYFLALYGLLYNKQRWEAYVREFSGESEPDRKRGNRWAIAFLAGSVLLDLLSIDYKYFDVFLKKKQQYGNFQYLSQP